MSIEAVAIRLNPIDHLLGNSLSELRGLSPVVFTADQGLLGATAEHGLVLPSPLRAGHNPGNSQQRTRESEQYGRLQPKNALGRVIFIVDSSKSMLRPLQKEGSKETRSEYVTRRFLTLPADYLGKDTRMSLISFGRTATEVISRDKSGISAVQHAFRSGLVVPIGGTQFPPALELSVDILKEDCLTYGEASRPVVVLLTDGKDKSGEEEANFLMRTLRRLNCGLFIAGIGEDYKMKRVVQLAGYGGFSTWGHAAMESGKGARNASYDLFTGLIPRLREGIINSDEYLTFSVAGGHSHLTSASLSFFAPPPGECTVTAGYVQQGRGLLFHDRRKKLSIDLEVRPFASSKDVVEKPVRILDECEAAPYFETLEASRALVTQWLLSMAYANGDQTLAERVKKSIKPEDPLSKLASRLKGLSDETDIHSRLSDETECGTVRQSRDLPFDDPAQEPRPNEKTPGERTFASNADSQSSANLHSGNLNFLDASLGGFSLPPVNRPNAANYNRVPGGSFPSLIFQSQNGEAPLVKTLETIFTRGAVIRIGRSPECEVKVNTPDVSRYHCSLEWVGGYFWIKDEGSLNGTKLNGANIGRGVPRCIRDGDTVSIGDAQFTFTHPKR